MIHAKTLSTWNEAALQQCSVGSSLPPDIAEKILRVRDSLIADDYSEAWHWLYSIASPEFDKMSDDVWTDLETAAGRL